MTYSAPAVAAFANLGSNRRTSPRRPPRCPAATLSGRQRQSVVVASAVAYASKVIFMDEPTAALGVVQRGRVLDNIRRIRDRGLTIALISHNMPEVLAVATASRCCAWDGASPRFTAAQTTIEQLAAR